MKEDPDLKNIPVVMLTSSNRETDILKSYSNGACSFVSKPVGFENLRKVTHQFALYWSLIASVPGHNGQQ
jgi:CheY-like chemotaxis protein